MHEILVTILSTAQAAQFLGLYGRVMERNEGQARPCSASAGIDTLLVVDDDDEIRELLCEYLSESGYRVLAAASGGEMWQQLDEKPVHLLILDLMLPGEDGLSLCRQVQALNGPGVIMLSAKGTALDRIVGLEVGADDYLSKPFEPRELLARVKAVLRRAGATRARKQPEVINESIAPTCFASYRLDHAKRMLIQPNGNALLLPRSDYRVLAELLTAQNRVLSRDHLTRCAFARAHMPDDRSVDMCISRLRQHLKQGGERLQILTIRNEGYLFSVAANHAAL